MTQKPKVLVVDDSDVVLSWVETALSHRYDVVGQRSPLDAPVTILRECPDLILLDVNMPVLQGDNLVSLAREATMGRDTPVVLYSGLPAGELQSRAQACGADGFISKSDDVESFRDHVAALIRGEEGLVQTSSTPSLREEDPTGAKVLLAGRDILMTEVGTTLQERFEVSAAQSGQEVLSSVRLASPVLLVVGPDLPDMSAAKLCRAVRGDPELARASILFVGAPGDAKRANGARAAGANKILLKPFDELTFFGMVGTLTNVAARRHSRLMVRIEVSVDTDGAFFVGFSHNLSASGMLLQSDFQANVGDAVSLRFFVTGRAEEIATDAEVIRVQIRDTRQPTFAVQFSTLQDPDRSAIERFVQSQDTH